MTSSAITAKVGSLVKMTINSTGIGLYATTPVAQASRVGQLTDSTGGSTSSNGGAVVDVGASPDQTKINDNLAKLAARVNALELALHNIGITA
jgi:hypothetical protein